MDYDKIVDTIDLELIVARTRVSDLEEARETITKLRGDQKFGSREVTAVKRKDRSAERERARKMYEEDSMLVKDIAVACGVSEATIYGWSGGKWKRPKKKSAPANGTGE